MMKGVLRTSSMLQMLKTWKVFDVAVFGGVLKMRKRLYGQLPETDRKDAPAQASSKL